MIKRLMQIVSGLCLILLVMASVLFLTGKLPSLDKVKLLMLIATAVWFISTPVWMWKEKGQ